MKASRTFASAAVALALAATATACGGGSTDSSGGGSSSGKTLTYWASNQGTSVNVDKQVLGPELKKFTQQTGIKVNLEVVPWSDLLNRIMAAASSGQGPDVLNIGNSWSASLQATGALLPWDSANMAKIGGASKFNASALASTGVAGQPPAAVPLYALSYGLYWNKAEFKKAGIAGPPATWSQLIADGKKLTGNGKWGIALECGQYQENAHHAFAFGQQLGANFFTKAGKPDFDSPQAVQAVKQYVDLMATDKIASPGDAEYANNQSVTDFATGKAAMLLWQAAGTSLKLQGMKTDQFGVAPVPFQTANPTGSGKIDTMAAGINMAVFKNSKNLSGAEKFVNFMTSTAEQKIINGKYGSISPVQAAASQAVNPTPELATLKQVLANNSAPLPQVADESNFETLVGTAMKNLFADAAGGKSVTDSTVKSELTKAQQQMPAS
ncbi:sugar ABC transporter substrate-binding protein [Streptomyces sp. SL13]|uniref:Sugar ABC transporter substrate-binding protein n=1 Tax=Streptantibioticus silvisoli TaxID=2705255 RepID=A0AA90KBZ6_9ACTN|nr:sugar ABC transporter substrate-binding protein [Streptantibioticus silvisoli]MDI5973962.1 sugar ABC transporter substrate-binding protein [Streptantibioticus silvisoli]